jgi:pyridoxamine 5'-phosphate oxidase
MNIASIRTDYKLKTLDISDVAAHGLEQFKQWFLEAIEAQVNEPNAMNLATVKSNGAPSSRIVLLKGLENEAFNFFTNYQSHKGQQLAQSRAGALCFFWPELERQVRIEGQITKVSEADSDEYFYSRPLESRIGAWVSPQSEVITGREVLDVNFKRIAEQFKDKEVTRPAHWGGYALKPQTIEFWQGRPSRLHDRILYTLEGNTWKIERLAP